MSNPGWSDEGLTALILEHEMSPDSYSKLIEYRKEVGQVECVRRMLAIFRKCSSSELCEGAWDVSFTICLTDDEPEMDEESARLWTDAILTALKHKRPEIRSAAADALGLRLRRENFTELIVNALITGLGDESKDVRSASGLALQHAGRLALAPVLKLLSDDRHLKADPNDEDGCSSVWDILCTVDGIFPLSLPSPEERRLCSKAVAKFLRDRSEGDGVAYLDVWKAGETLGEYIGGREGLEELSALIRHPNPLVRASVAHGLSHLKEPEAREQLHVLLHDGDEGVRNEAAKYLNRPLGCG